MKYVLKERIEIFLMIHNLECLNYTIMIEGPMDNPTGFSLLQVAINANGEYEDAGGALEYDGPPESSDGFGSSGRQFRTAASGDVQSTGFNQAFRAPSQMERADDGD